MPEQPASLPPALPAFPSKPAWRHFEAHSSAGRGRGAWAGGGGRKSPPPRPVAGKAPSWGRGGESSAAAREEPPSPPHRSRDSPKLPPGSWLRPGSGPAGWKPPGGRRQNQERAASHPHPPGGGPREARTGREDTRGEGEAAGREKPPPRPTVAPDLMGKPSQRFLASPPPAAACVCGGGGELCPWALGGGVGSAGAGRPAEGPTAGRTGSGRAAQPRQRSSGCALLCLPAREPGGGGSPSPAPCGGETPPTPPRPSHLAAPWPRPSQAVAAAAAAPSPAAPTLAPSAAPHSPWPPPERTARCPERPPDPAGEPRPPPRHKGGGRGGAERVRVRTGASPAGDPRTPASLSVP